MAVKKYKMQIEIDGSLAVAAANKAAADLAKVEAAARRAADATEAVGRAGASGGEQAAGGMARFAAAAAVAQVGLQKMFELAQGFGSAMDAAGKKQQEFADRFASSRDKLGELAAMRNLPLTNAFALQEARFNVATGFRPDESTSFQKAFYGSGAQHIGKTISDKEAEQLKLQAGQLAVARHLDPDAVGKLAGKAIGFKDYKKFGVDASENALGDTFSALGILERGEGDTSVNLNQLSELSSAAVNEDEFKGVFKNINEAAIMISVMAEKDPGAAATFARASVRGLRDFGGKPGELLKKAGITPGMSPFEAVEKLAPVVEAEAKRKGVKTEDVLRENFSDEREIQGIGVLINKGAGATGVIADRRKYAAEHGGPDAAFAAIDQFQASEAGMSRRADAEVGLAEAERGEEGSKLAILRKQAIASLTKQHVLDSSSQKIQDFLADTLTFGVLPSSEQGRIDKEAQNILNARRPKGMRERGWGGNTSP
jgi:hypothetical protein